jgi:hypothetical protein
MMAPESGKVAAGLLDPPFEIGKAGLKARLYED